MMVKLTHGARMKARTDKEKKMVTNPERLANVLRIRDDDTEKAKEILKLALNTLENSKALVRLRKMRKDYGQGRKIDENNQILLNANNRAPLYLLYADGGDKTSVIGLWEDALLPVTESIPGPKRYDAAARKEKVKREKDSLRKSKKLVEIEEEAAREPDSPRSREVLELRARKRKSLYEVLKQQKVLGGQVGDLAQARIDRMKAEDADDKTKGHKR